MGLEKLSILCVVVLLASSFAVAEIELLAETLGEAPDIPDIKEVNFDFSDPIPLLEDPQAKDDSYFFDTTPNGVVFLDIGKYENDVYTTSAFKTADPTSLSAEQTYQRLKSQVANLDENTEFFPGFRDEVLQVHLYDYGAYEDEPFIFAATVQEGEFVPVSYVDDGLSGLQDANVFATTETVNTILNADDVRGAAQEALSDKSIRVKGVGLFNRFKYGLANFIMSTLNWVQDIFYQTTTVTTVTTRYFDSAGNLVRTEVDVSEETTVEYIGTVDTTEVSVEERARLVEVTDCEDAKKRWEELQQQYRAKDCTPEKQALDEATIELNEAKTTKEAAQLAYDSAVSDMEAAQEDYINFFKNSIFRDDVKFEPQEGWNSMGLSGTDFTIYFSDDGSALLDYLEDNSDGYGEVQRAFFDARRKVKELAEELEQAEAAEKAAQEKYDAAKTAYEACLKEKADLQAAVSTFEAEWRECVQILKEQEEIKNGLAPRTLAIVEDASTTVRSIPQPKLGSSPCPEADELRSQAGEARSQAQFQASKARSKYNDASRNFEEGNLDAAKADLEAAQAAAREAKQKAAEATNLARRADAAQDNCDRKAQQEAEQEERSSSGSSSSSSSSSGSTSQDERTGTQVREDIAEEYFEEAQEVDKNHLRIGAFRELKAMTQGSCLENCEEKLIKLTQDNMAGVFSDLTFNLGIGVIAAPVDALSPSSLVGKVAQKVTAGLLRYAVSDGLSDFAVKTITNEIGGALFPKLLGNDDLGNHYNNLVQTQIPFGDLLREEGVKVYKFNNHEDPRIWSRCSGWIKCKGETTMFYNPHTRYVVLMTSADCCPGVLTIKYKVDENGIRVGPMSKKYIR